MPRQIVYCVGDLVLNGKGDGQPSDIFHYTELPTRYIAHEDSPTQFPAALERPSAPHHVLQPPPRDNMRGVRGHTANNGIVRANGRGVLREREPLGENTSEWSPQQALLSTPSPLNRWARFDNLSRLRFEGFSDEE
ncbi:hypothetical protein Tcan_14533 [Toxocara canis]|uniref:Uncharacterized protein n=1 Tax=Toxocara canis TaxID=6265 RepID=A0A0B2V1I0_TOXCA|nr:hypothetical protein Tcan_14533 [Toxocara canis]